MPDVKIPLIGNVPRGGVIVGGIAGAGVLGYIWWKKKTAAATTTQTPYAYGYGTPDGYYGYGYGYGSSMSMGSGITPAPIGSEYGYGAYGYGYYNPYTGQYLGGGTGTTITPGQPPSWWTVPPAWWQPPPKPHGHKPGTSVITADGKLDLAQIAGRHHTTRWQIVAWNPHLAYLLNTKRPVPRGTRVKV